MESSVRAYYRKHDDYRRYLMSNDGRVRDLVRFFKENELYLGRSILDIACGGGVFGFLAEERGRRYVGIDVNPDAVSSARKYAEGVGSSNEFILGDARKMKVSGTFDTITLLGNALCHFNTAEVEDILESVRGNVKRG